MSDVEGFAIPVKFAVSGGTLEGGAEVVVVSLGVVVPSAQDLGVQDAVLAFDSADAATLAEMMSKVAAGIPTVEEQAAAAAGEENT